MSRRRYIHDRDRVAADELLVDVRGELELEEADFEMLKAISRGENIQNADLAIAAMRLRLEYSARKPEVAVDVGTRILVVADPYALPPTGATALPPPRGALPGAAQVIDGELVEVAPA
jgi:hypothetical protein